ncbi:MAG: exodeoxyribonuclease III [Cytophagia bacterium]|nr:MAG: exodeoxyribonuclease III [Cytophagia bacterium]TAG42237.1 MAG: exodeoxyribonuclease III [Cytophagia bacterium]
MKIITYNVNGLRAVIQKGFVEWLKATQADVICLQETKAYSSQIPLVLFEELGYQTYFQSAEKKGYSGVAIFTKNMPKKITKGYDLPSEIDDNEGRIIRADFEDLSILSVYMPSGSSGEDRRDFKMRWNRNFHQYIQMLKKEIPNLLIVGDYNICHQPIDIHNPKANMKTSGFLPEEREWLDSFFESGFVDTFRHLNKEPHNYTWWSAWGTAREKNLGWRIDYQAISSHLIDRLQRAVILNEVKFSDHCPVLIEIE